MTKKQKTRKKSDIRHRNYASQLRRRILIPVVAGMMLVGGLAGAVNATLPKPEVLAYATNVSVAGLTSSTNQARSANGIGGLSINAQLNSAAQSKAADMVAKDYWAHTSPDGRQPWDFVLAAGYSYQTAGENLAYGALTSQQTVDAWMNSSGHRANILNGNFTEVGFGFVNAENFQSRGQQTVIVAMYAAPYAPAPVPKPAPPPEPTVQSSQQTAAPEPTPQAPAADASPSEKEPEKDKTTEKEEPKPIDEPVPSTEQQGNVEEVRAKPDTIRRVEVLSGVYAPWLVSSVAVGGVGAYGSFLYTHSRRWHRWILKGERFVAHHVLLDVAVLALAVAAYFMLQSVATIL